MHNPLRSNPLLEQTLRAGRWPSLRVTLVLLAVLWIATVPIGPGYIVSAVLQSLFLYFPILATLLFLPLWLLPLLTVIVAAYSTAQQMRTEAFQLIKQSPLSDHQVTWGLGLSTLYDLRVWLALALGLLPMPMIGHPVEDIIALELSLAGLHLAAAILGTVLALQWDRRPLGAGLTALCCTLILILLPIYKLPALGSACLLSAYFPIDILLRRALPGPLEMIAVAAPIFLIGWAASRIPWRELKGQWLPRLEMVGSVLVVLLMVGMWLVKANQVEARERQALVALYQATGGENWLWNRGWLSEQPVCTWVSVTCTCGRVVAINLGEQPSGPSYHLSGQLPSEVGQLANLGYLLVRGNGLTGLPPEIGQLTRLEYLDISRNQFQKLPPEIGQLTSLLTLDVSSNALTELPPEIGQLTNLQTLDVSSNALTELPPEICQLPLLRNKPRDLCD